MSLPITRMRRTMVHRGRLMFARGEDALSIWFRPPEAPEQIRLVGWVGAFNDQGRAQAVSATQYAPPMGNRSEVLTYLRAWKRKQCEQF